MIRSYNCTHTCKMYNEIRVNISCICAYQKIGWIFSAHHSERSRKRGGKSERGKEKGKEKKERKSEGKVHRKKNGFTYAIFDTDLDSFIG